MNPLNWNSWFRADESCPWTWISSGTFYGEAHSAALLKVGTGGQLITLFGRVMPDRNGAPQRTRRAW
jgi:hypothetical protein